jgi:hypothetical protein
MGKPITKEFDFGEYIVYITYYGDGKIDVSILDEFGDEIEGIYISDDDGNSDNNRFDFNLN